MMKLHVRPASPFGRKVRVVAIETGLIDKIEIVMAQTPDESRQTVLQINPLVKIPVLELEDGSSLYDSRVIVEYLDGLHERAKLLPRNGTERWRVSKLQALGDGIGDAAALIGGEASRPDNLRSEAAIARQWEKIVNGTMALENDMKQLDGPLNIGQIAVACSLGYADFRLADHPWRDGRPKLAAWIETFNERPSMRATYFPRPNR